MNTTQVHKAHGTTPARVPFLSQCPKCKHSQAQWYNRGALLRLLNGDHPVEGHCVTCDEYWIISADERAGLARALGWAGHFMAEVSHVVAATAFFSTCPRCKHPQLQSGYERFELLESLDAGQAIDAYCPQCDAVWPISAQERLLVARAITPDLHDPPLSLRKRLR
jgi:Zn-finger nucleic acid-binding protein